MQNYPCFMNLYKRENTRALHFFVKLFSRLVHVGYRANTTRIHQTCAYPPGYGKKKEIPYENISRRRSETRVVAAYGFALGCSEGEVRTVWKWWKSFLRHCQPPPVRITSLSPSPVPQPRLSPPRRRVPKNLEPRSLSIHLNIIISFRASSVFRASSFLFLSLLSRSLASRRPNRAIRAQEFDLPVFPLVKTTFRPFPAPGTDPPASVTGTLHLPEHHHLRINRVWKINVPRGDLWGGEDASARVGQRKGEKEGQNGTHAEVPVSHVNEIQGIFCRGWDSLLERASDAAFEKLLDNKRDNDQSIGCVRI